MRRLSRRCIEAALLVHAVASPALEQDKAPPVVGGGCPAELNRLVSYLEETAALEGALLHVRRTGDGVLLYYEDYVQRIRCIDDVIHVDFH